MTRIERAKEVFVRTLSILQIEEQMYEVEDEYLETWMMEGCPNGSTVTEIMEDVDDDETYHEWLTLGKELLSRREKEEADYQPLFWCAVELRFVAVFGIKDLDEKFK